ncbi:hypothetical protein ACTFIY_012197 [Dictyostelium cf. discoideum]
MANLNQSSSSIQVPKLSKYMISFGYFLMGIIVTVTMFLSNNNNFSIVSYTLLSEIIFGVIISSLHIGFSIFAFPGNSSTLDKINRSLIGLSIGNFIFYFLLILYGAPFLKSIHTTFFFGFLLSSMCCLPPSILLGLNPQNWKDLFFTPNHNNIIDTCTTILVVFSILGAWIGAFPIPLDWDRPWQQWPISCVFGSIVGHIFGLFICSVYSLVHKEKKSM